MTMPDSGAARRGRGRPEEIQFDFGDDEPAQDRRRRSPVARPTPGERMPTSHPTPRVPVHSDRGTSPPEPERVKLPRDSDLVFVPARPNAQGDGVEIETRRLADNNVPVGLAFTTLAALVTNLGDYQPWVKLPMVAYVAALRRAGVDRVQIDPAPTNGLWRWDETTLVERMKGEG